MLFGRRNLALCCLCPLLAAGAAHGQLLYNQKKDELAQHALTMAKGLASGASFDKQLDNLSRLQKLSNDRVFGGAEVQARSNLLRLTTWKGAQTLINEVAGRLTASKQAITAAQYDTAKAAAAEEVDKAKAELKAIQDELKAMAAGAGAANSADRSATSPDKPNNPAISNEQVASAELQAEARTAAPWLSRASVVSELADFVRKLPPVSPAATNVPAAYLDAAREAANLASSLAELYKNFKVTLPRNSAAIALETHLDLLEAEERHFGNLGMIAARRDREVADMLSLIEEAQNQLDAIAKLQMPRDIGDSLRKGIDAYNKAKPAPRKLRADELFTMVHCLYNVTAIATRDDTPIRLATLRLVAEEREYSIRQAAIGARSYEQAIVSGMERLALYHKGGVKPQTLAAFINALATVGLIPAVLTR